MTPQFLRIYRISLLRHFSDFSPVLNGEVSLQTHIYIYTTQRLRYPREALQFFAYIPGAFEVYHGIRSKDLVR